jgi:hypothetical protein
VKHKAQYLRAFIGDYGAADIKTIRQDYRKVHGRPAGPVPVTRQAPPAPADWRADKTARALGKVTND